MTEAQTKEISTLKLIYEKNVNEYILNNSSKYCSFNLFKNSINEKDTSITVAINTIVSIGDDDIPRTKLSYINIIENGNAVNLNDMLNLQEQGNYIKNLIKIES